MAAAKKSPAPKAEKAAPAPKTAKVEKPKREPLPTQNGVTRPAGDKTGAVWDIADKLSKQFRRPATRGEVFAHIAELPEDERINDATVATQYQRWRTFHGVPKAAPVVKEAKAPKAPKAEKPAPKAKKAAAAAA